MVKESGRAWAEHVRRWRRSGLTAAEYATREGLSTSTLYGWSSRLGKKDGLAGAHFIEVPPAPAETAPAAANPRTIELQVGTAITIKVEQGFDPKLLREVVAALVTP